MLVEDVHEIVEDPEVEGGREHPPPGAPLVSPAGQQASTQPRHQGVVEVRLVHVLRAAQKHLGVFGVEDVETRLGEKAELEKPFFSVRLRPAEQQLVEGVAKAYLVRVSYQRQRRRSWISEI